MHPLYAQRIDRAISRPFSSTSSRPARIGTDGSGQHQFTHGTANQVVPSFSRDGGFVYYASDRTGRFEIWRAPAGGGAEEQVTREGGVEPLESLDGRTLYYMRNIGQGPLLARPTAGGEERTILSCVRTFTYAVTARGLLHVACVGPDAVRSTERSLLSWEAATGQDQAVAKLEADFVQGLSVSPDGRSVLYGGSRATSNLMMIESFR
jgi:hypothetical protein